MKNQPHKKPASKVTTSDIATSNGALIERQSAYMEIPESALVLTVISNMPDQGMQDRCMRVIEANAEQGREIRNKAQERAEGRADVVCKAEMKRKDHWLVFRMVYSVLILLLFTFAIWKGCTASQLLALGVISVFIPYSISSRFPWSKNRNKTADK